MERLGSGIVSEKVTLTLVRNKYVDNENLLKSSNKTFSKKPSAVFLGNLNLKLARPDSEACPFHSKYIFIICYKHSSLTAKNGKILIGSTPGFGVCGNFQELFNPCK